MVRRSDNSITGQGAGWPFSLTAAALTGLFCMGFALIVDLLTQHLSVVQAVALSFTSGFCGSVFAQLLLRRR